MKKYLDAAKMYPYYCMNPQLGSSMNPSVNPNVNPNSINPSLSSQYGIPMQMPNSYMGYPGGPSMSVSNYGQLKNPPPPRSMSSPGMPFGMNPGMNCYSIPRTGSMYPPQYMGPYGQNLVGGYGQTPSPSFSQMMGLDKPEQNFKNIEISKFTSN